MRVLIGVDDTDNLESRGTGFHSRQLGNSLSESGFARPESITRHQLLVDPRIPYTSHNSSACLVVELKENRLDALANHCRKYLLEISAEGSDVGLCIAPFQTIETNPEIVEFGQRAKIEVLSKGNAEALARSAGILLEGLTGTHGGVIGALAAVGLRFEGNDGRHLWLPGMRDIEGVFTLEELLEKTTIEEVRSLDGTPVTPGSRIQVGDWLRTIMQNGRATLYVDKEENDGNSDWKVAAKEFIKQRS